MKATQPLISNAIFEMEQALERMPIRSSAIARPTLKLALPIPETRQDIERYVHSLLTKEEGAVCDMATD